MLRAPVATIRWMTASTSKQGKVTDEHRAEAARLREIWATQKHRLQTLGHGTQELFGEKFGIGNQSAVGFFLNGKTALSLKAALGFANGLNCQVADFSPRLATLLPKAGEKLSPNGLSDEEARLIQLLRGLNSEVARGKVYAYAEGLAAVAAPEAAPKLARALPIAGPRKARRAA